MGLLNLNPNNPLKCVDNTSIKALIFDNRKMSITFGAKTLLEVFLDDFYMIVDRYSYQEFTLEANSTVTIDQLNVGSAAGEVKYIAVIVKYPKTDINEDDVTADQKYLTMEYPTGGQVMNIGQIMMLSGATGHGWDLLASPGGMKFTNPSVTFDVTIRILLIN